MNRTKGPVPYPRQSTGALGRLGTGALWAAVCLALWGAPTAGAETTLSQGGTNEGGYDTSSASMEMQYIVGGPVGGSLSTSGGYHFSMLTGFPETSDAGVLPPSPVPMDMLAVRDLTAKTAPMGATIPAATWQHVSDPYFTWTAPEAQEMVAGYSFALDVAPDEFLDTATTSHQVPEGLLVDGQHTFTVQALLSSGTAGPPSSFALWVDVTPPVIQSLVPASGALLNQAAPIISAHVTDTASGVAVSGLALQVNNQAVTPSYDAGSGLMSHTPGGLGDGHVTVALTAGDVAGNQATPLVWSFTLDTQAPTGTLVINGGDQSTSTVYVNLTPAAEDALSGVDQMELSNAPTFTGAWQPYSAFVANWALEPVSGAQHVYARFRDRAGNVSAPVVASIELAVNAPDTLLLSGPSGVTPETAARFSFSSSAGGALFAVQLDTGEWSGWTSTTEFSTDTLTPGNHYFKVKSAKDADGNGQVDLDEEDPTPAERTWTVGEATVPQLAPTNQPVKFWRVE